MPIRQSDTYRENFVRVLVDALPLLLSQHPLSHSPSHFSGIHSGQSDSHSGIRATLTQSHPRNRLQVHNRYPIVGVDIRNHNNPPPLVNCHQLVCRHRDGIGAIFCSRCEEPGYFSVSGRETPDRYLFTTPLSYNFDVETRCIPGPFQRMARPQLGLKAPLVSHLLQPVYPALEALHHDSVHRW